MRGAGEDVPWLVLTARDALHDRVAGFEAGADDYLPKHFAMDELVARVRALLRRPVERRPLDPSHGDLTIRPGAGVMCSGDEIVTLAPADCPSREPPRWTRNPHLAYAPGAREPVLQ